METNRIRRSDLMKKLNKPLFSLYETTFLVIKTNLGYDQALELFYEIVDNSLGNALNEYIFEKGNPKDFAKIMKKRDESVGNKVTFKVTNDKIIYRVHTNIMPNLRGHMSINDYANVLVGIKIKHLLGKGWVFKISKHLWKGDKFSEYIITRE